MTSSTSPNPLSERRFLRGLEKAWSRFEAFLNRFLTSDFNPLYHLGTLSIYLLIVITITGIYLTVIYRPGTEAAIVTMEKISGNWFGLLMRSVHRYASDGLIIALFLHAFKTLISDRFWGSRWLAWVSGWALLALIWNIGTMGYWLVWDLRAQWMTEYLINSLGGSVALTFINPEIASSTFAVFVIVLFSHVFLPVGVLVGLLIHVLRLARSRWWAPRWLMVQSVIALVIISLWKPSVSAAPADLSRMIESVRLDWLYLGLLPLIDRMGDPLFWGLSLLVWGGLTALPWLTKGRSMGPAQVIDSGCTGCTLCAVECPYNALEMVARQDETRFKKIVEINPNLCTGCGLCVGTCATAGIELTGLPSPLVVEGMRGALALEKAANREPIVVFTCQRQAALGSIPAPLLADQYTPELLPMAGLQPLPPSPVTTGTWGNGASSEGSRVITCTLPCVGMADVNWIKEFLANGAKDVALVSCPYDDCNYREGPQWESSRLRRRKALLKPNLHWLEVAPGESRPVATLLDTLHQTSAQETPPALPTTSKARLQAKPRALAAGLGLLLLTLLFALAVPLELPGGTLAAENSQLRITLEHGGVMISTVDASKYTLPEGVSAAEIMGGERHPVQLRLEIDGALALEKTYEPAGLRREGDIVELEVLPLSPGVHQITIQIKDDDGEWREVFTGEIEAPVAEVVDLAYDEEADTFELLKIGK